MTAPDICRDEFLSVCGKMVACRAADKLGITVARFYYLAQRYSVSTAFVRPLWSESENQRLIAMRKSGMSIKQVAHVLNRTEESIIQRICVLRRGGRI